jgi:hypothetical protein
MWTQISYYVFCVSPKVWSFYGRGATKQWSTSQGEWEFKGGRMGQSSINIFGIFRHVIDVIRLLFVGSYQCNRRLWYNTCWSINLRRDMVHCLFSFADTKVTWQSTRYWALPRQNDVFMVRNILKLITRPTGSALVNEASGGRNWN